MVYRLEAKEAVRRVKKISNAHIFEEAVSFKAVVSRTAARRRLINDLLSVFGSQPRPVVAHLIRAGKLTLDDVKDAERTLEAPEEGATAMMAASSLSLSGALQQVGSHLWQSTLCLVVV